jgi:hypothetical protein
MTSVLPDLERDLVAAASRQAGRAATYRGRGGAVLGWLRGRSRTAQLLVGLVVVSAAAASAAALAGTSSQPLSGAVSANVRYKIVVTPFLSAGEIGWCISDSQSSSRGRLLGGVGSCESGTAALGSPVFASIPGPTIAVLAAPQVAAVRITNGLTILTRGDPRLPYGFRAAVFNAHRLFDGVATYRPESLTALDARGRQIPGAIGRASALFGLGVTTPALPTRAWARVGANLQVSGYVLSFPHQGQAVSQTPPSGGCATTARPGSPLRAQGGVDVTEIAADPAIIGRAFLDCSDTLYTANGKPTVVSVLLDAKHPGVPPAALPGMHAVRGEAGVFALSSGLPLFARRGVARRVGDAWLVASGPGTAEQHAHVLGQLKVRSIDLRPPIVTRSGPRNVPCSIGYRPLRGLLEAIQTPWRGPPPAWGPNARLYPCTSATFYLNDWPLQARVFAPIREPGTPHHPALHPIAGHPDTFAVDVNGYTGPGLWRKVGRSWLVITGGNGTHQELALSDALSVTTAAT